MPNERIFAPMAKLRVTCTCGAIYEMIESKGFSKDPRPSKRVLCDREVFPPDRETVGQLHPGIPPAWLATYTGDFNTVDDARKAAIADADNPKIGAVDSITIEPIGERWVKGESLIRTGTGWERRREPE